MKIGDMDWSDSVMQAYEAGRYYFRLVWDDGTIVDWSQTSSPMQSTIAGFEAGSTNIQDQDSGFIGLGVSSSGSCIIDGNGGNGNWWNCAGIVGTHRGNIPGFDRRIASGFELYIAKAGLLATVENGCDCLPGYTNSAGTPTGGGKITATTVAPLFYAPVEGCVEINECTTPSMPCADQENGEHAPCHDLIDDFSCDCDPNHYGKTCTDTYVDCVHTNDINSDTGVNEDKALCDFGTCNEEVRTHFTVAKHSCTCSPGYHVGPDGVMCDTDVRCPVNSHGTNVALGCECDAGFSEGENTIGATEGVIVATTSAPYYTGVCLPDPCMEDPAITYLTADKSDCEHTIHGETCTYVCDYGFHVTGVATCMLGQWDAPTCEVTDMVGALRYCNLYPRLQNTFCGGNTCTTDAQARVCQNNWNTFGSVSTTRDENGLRKDGQPWGDASNMHPCASDPSISNMDEAATTCEGTASNTECTVACDAGFVPASVGLVLSSIPGLQNFTDDVNSNLEAGGDKAKCIGDAWNNDAEDVRQCIPVSCPRWVSDDDFSPILASAGSTVTSGCECHPRLSGDILPTQTAPYFSQTCAPNDCTIPPIFLGRSDGLPSVASWTGENCALDATDVHHGTVCTIVTNPGWTCTSPGRCIAQQFEHEASCTPLDCHVPEFPAAPTNPGLYGEGIANWNNDRCRSGVTDVTHMMSCTITPEFGYDCVSPGECYAEVFANTDAKCEAYSCTRPLTEEMETKHGDKWNRLDAYEINEVDLRAANRYFDVQVKCAAGYVGTPEVSVCTGGADSQYYIHGCNLDSDLDGHADDDEECENDPLKTEAGLCGCQESDLDELTGEVNCATSTGIGMDAAFDGNHFYKTETKSWAAKEANSWKQAVVGTEFSAASGGATWVKLADSWLERGEYGATEHNYAFSQSPETGKMFSATFIVDEPVLAFQSGLGAVGATVQLMTQADDGRFTRVRKELAPTGPVQQHMWDVSGMFQEHAQLVITNPVDGERMYFNNVRMFHSEQGCIAECMTIVRSAHHDGIAFMGEDEAKSMYLPVNKNTFDSAKQELYCRDTFTGRISFGAALGAPFAGGLPEGMTYGNIDLARLPSCLMIRIIDDSSIEIAVTATSRRFQYSTQYIPDNISPASDDMKSSLHCVYPTTQPRCIDYFGILMNMQSAKMMCSEVAPAVVCVETALSFKCPLKADVLCGKEKMERDLLSCCDKDGNHPNNGCLNRRRLGHNIQISPDTILDMDAAEACARSCLKQPDDATCVGWRLEEDSDKCKIAYECHLEKDYINNEALVFGLEKQVWHLKTPETNPFAGKQVGPNGGKSVAH
jgi:hypothetical protein